MKYCIALVGVFFSFVNAMDQSMDFSNYHSLTKPNNMGGMAWLRALEDQRTKADSSGNIEAFKGFSKEISLTIAGKYGLSSRVATLEEQADLIRSITRTRLKFRDEKEMLPELYILDAVHNLSSQHQSQLAAILTIDTLAAASIGNTGFLNQWSEVKAEQPISRQFINNIKEQAKLWTRCTREPLFAALEPSIDSFLRNSQTIVLTHKEFIISRDKYKLVRTQSSAPPKTNDFFRNLHLRAEELAFDSFPLKDQIAILMQTQVLKVKILRKNLKETGQRLFKPKLVLLLTHRQ